MLLLNLLFVSLHIRICFCAPMMPGKPGGGCGANPGGVRPGCICGSSRRRCWALCCRSDRCLCRAAYNACDSTTVR